MKNNSQTKKLPGFYIALCCCVIAIGVAGFFLQGEDDETTVNTPAIVAVNEDETGKSDDASVSEIETYEEMPIEVAQNETVDSEKFVEYPPAEEIPEDYTTDNPDVVSAAVVVNAEENCNFTNPVNEMTIKYGFATDTLMYNEFYGDWRTHNGIDIEAPIGCSVAATADGTVTRVMKGSYGNTVIIAHNDGFDTVYAQLGEVSVAEGDNVKQGDVIGTVGESTGENMTDSHLHYEIHKDGKAVNPEEY